MSTVLSVNNLSISFHQKDSDVHIVKNISFDISNCETVALVGESGSGKSLTAHAIMRLLPYPTAFHPSGEIAFDGKDLLSMSDSIMRDIRGSQIGMIFQEPMSALNPLHTVEKQIGEILKVHHKTCKKDISKEVIKLLEQVHIADAASKLKAYPHQLSGGQRQRVMIAMALANRPKLLIADEPTTALDVTIQKEILDLLKELQQQYKMSILFITHDLGVVRYIADKVIVMRDGQIVERNETQALYEQPQNDYTQLLIDSHPSGDPVALECPKEGQLPIVETQSLCVSFPVYKPLFGRCKHFFHALKSINIKLDEGSTLGVVGESGSGKSTLAYAMMRLLPSNGHILLEGSPIENLTPKEMCSVRRDLQIVFQDPFASLSPRMSIQQIISEGLTLHFSLSKQETERQVIEIMKEVDLDPETRHRYPHEFSGGQRQRISIARALVLNPKVLFLDEPTSALDLAVQAQVIDLLRRLQEKRKLSYIFISHDMQVIKAISHNIVVMKGGDIVEFGNSKQIFAQPSHPYTKTLLEATLY